MTSISLLFRSKTFLVILSILVAYFVLPAFFIFVAAPLYIYRRIIIFLSKWKNGFYDPLTVDDCLHVNDDFHGHPRSTISAVICLKDSHSFEELVTKLKGLADKHPRSMCTITRWMSVYFWKKCEDFKISDHVFLNEESDPEKLSKVINNFIEKGFPAGKPIWEFMSLPNYAHAEYGTSSAIAMRTHHTIGDALAFVSLVRDLGDKDPAADEEVAKLMKAIRKKINLNFWRKLSYLFQLMFITPAQVTYCWFNALSAQGIPRNLNRDSNSDSNGSVNVSTLIDLTLLKRISKKTGANVTSVVNAGVAGAVRRTILERGGDPNGDISAIYALPKLNHPRTMSNNAFAVPLVTPMSGEDRFQRLARISKELEHLFHSALPIGMIIHFATFGLVLGILGQMKIMPNSCTYIHSNGAYFGGTMKMFGTSLERGVFSPGLQREGNSLIVVTLSYNGKLGVQLVGDKAVFPDEESLMRVANHVEDEFKLMDE